MPYQLGLPNALRRFGLTVEVVDGWGTRGWSGLNPRGSVSHWTASGGGPRPSLGVCIYGRPDLDGPLCNVFLDRSGTAVVVAAGMANHAGPGGYNGMSGNDSVFGTECEGTIGGRDGTDFTDAQRWAYPRVVAAYHYLTQTSPLTHACGHSEWTNQKIDVGSYAPILRRQAADLLAAPPAAPTPAPKPLMEDDMIRISAAGRGVAVIGPGYYRLLKTDEEVKAAGAIVSKTVEGNKRQFDLWKAMATQGTAAKP